VPQRKSSSKRSPGASAAKSDNASATPLDGFDWRFPVILVGTLVYLYLFYTADMRKLLALRWLLIPDVVVMDWMGSDAANFGLLDRIPILLAAGLILLLGYATGRLVLIAVVATERLTRLERMLFSVGVGLNLWSLYVLAVGLCGLLQSRWILFAPAAPVLILTALHYRRASDKRTAGDEPSVDVANKESKKLEAMHNSTGPRWSWTLIGFCTVFALFLLLGSVLPPWHFDVREYHLQVPKEWFQQGAAVFMPHNVYGNMPLGAEMHAILGMALMPGDDAWWWGALVGKTITGAFAILTALAIYATGRRFLTPYAGSVAAFAFLSTPWIAHASTAGLIESAVAFYFMLTVQATLIWWQEDKASGESDPADRSSPHNGQRGIVMLAGFLAGSAVACKYPSVLFLVIPILLFFLFGSGRTPRWRPAVVFLLAVACASGLWFGKNIVLTGNPTYPLLSGVFAGTTRTPEKNEQWKRAHHTPTDDNGNSFTVAHLVNSCRLLALKSQYVSPLLLPLVVAAWISRRNRPIVFWSTAFLLFGFFGWWLLTHRIDRFLLPLLPVVCLLVGIGATWSSNRIWRNCVMGFLIWCMVANLLLVTSYEIGDNRFLVALSELKTVTHRGHAYLNEHVQAGNVAMLVGDAQVFNVAVPVLYNTCFDDCYFEQMLRDRTTDDRREELRRQRISHVLVDWIELRRYRSPGNYGYSDYVTPELLQTEFVATGLLRPVPTELVPENGQIYEVVGWRDWDR
jgi:hypothetical protein